MTVAPVILGTQKWIQEFVVGHNICPFARKEFERGSVDYSVFTGNDTEKALHSLLALCEKLDNDEAIETTFLILADGFADFYQYLDLLALANSLIVQQDYEGIYQLASFHPEYCFEGEDARDASNYSNRSPYPMLHIIREERLEKALEYYSSPEEIPERNIAHCRELGVNALEKILKQCRDAGGVK